MTPDLAHRTAETLFPPPDFVDKFSRSRENPADGTAEALAEVDPHRIERRGLMPGRHARRDHGVHQPGAVHVKGEIVFPGHFGHGPNRLERPHRPPARVRRLFHFDQSASRRVTSGRSDGLLKLVRAVNAVPAVERPDHRPEHGERAGLGVDDVRRAIADDFVTGAAVDGDRGDVAPGARRHEDGRFLAEQLRHRFTESDGRGVRHRLLVTQLRGHHGFLHARRRPGLGIAVHVDANVSHRRVPSASASAGLRQSVGEKVQT